MQHFTTTVKPAKLPRTDTQATKAGMILAHLLSAGYSVEPAQPGDPAGTFARVSHEGVPVGVLSFSGTSMIGLVTTAYGLGLVADWKAINEHLATLTPRLYHQDAQQATDEAYMVEGHWNTLSRTPEQAAARFYGLNLWSGERPAHVAVYHAELATPALVHNLATSHAEQIAQQITTELRDFAGEATNDLTMGLAQPENLATLDQRIAPLIAAWISETAEGNGGMKFCRLTAPKDVTDPFVGSEPYPYLLERAATHAALHRQQSPGPTPPLKLSPAECVGVAIAHTNHPSRFKGSDQIMTAFGPVLLERA